MTHQQMHVCHHGRCQPPPPLLQTTMCAEENTSLIRFTQDCDAMKRWTRSEGRKQRACIEEEKPTWHNYWSRYVERDWRGDGGKEEGHGRTKGQLLRRE